MQGANRHFLERRGQADHTLRVELFAAAQGEDREAAIAALGSLRRIYRLRLPFQEARLGMNGNDLDSGFRRNDDGEPHR